MTKENLKTFILNLIDKQFCLEEYDAICPCSEFSDFNLLELSCPYLNEYNYFNKCNEDNNSFSSDCFYRDIERRKDCFCLWQNFFKKIEKELDEHLI